MLIVISPAKTLDFKTKSTTNKFSIPEFINDSKSLINQAKNLKPEDISTLMKISEKLAILNFERFQDWETPFDLDNSKQSILAFKGDVYTGLDAQTISKADLDWVNNHLRILSGLYGLLRPLDLMQAYRLEMGVKFENTNGKNLYEFWGDKITNSLNKDLENLEEPILLNLASNEYFKSIKIKSLAANIITPVFKDFKSGKYKIISFYAKKARGTMVRWIIDNKITNHRELINFNIDGYKYCEDESIHNELIFKRDLAK